MSRPGGTSANLSVVGQNFRPPHCPNMACKHYLRGRGWSWRKTGSFRRPNSPRRYQCFQCSHCRRYFSVRTFSPDYWLKRRELLLEITAWSPEGPGLRQTARRFGVSHATVARHLARSGRYSMVVHRRLVASHKVREPLAIDGFETFEYSQFFPYHLNLAAGVRSWFIYGFTDSPLRRKGRMTAKQKRRRAALELMHGRPDPKAIELGFRALLDQVLWAGRGLAADQVLELHTDEHPAYKRALAKYRLETGLAISHEVTPGTAPRTASNPLFAANLADLLLRHGQAAHRRETIAFCKRRQGAAERAAVFLFWRNYIKRRRENGKRVTAAQVAGVVDHPMEWRDAFRRRRFPCRTSLGDTWWEYYWRRVQTVVLGKAQSRHELKYAF